MKTNSGDKEVQIIQNLKFKKSLNPYHMAKEGLEVSPFGYNLVWIYIWIFQVDLLEYCDHVDSL